MTAIKSQHSRLVEQFLNEHRLALIGSLSAGVPEDYPAYRQLVGRLQGIDDALKMSSEADFKLSGDEPNERA